MTLLEILTATTGYLAKHHIESARTNAEHLLAHILGRKRIELYMEFDRPLGEKELAPLRDLMKRRATGEPLQHLLGTVEFHGRIFACDPRALVPRPETEQLVELVLAEQSKIENRKSKIVDVGTGSGVIALTLAAELPEAHVEAVDFTQDALALARENATRLGLAERVTFHQGDLLSPIEGTFDLIVANLPYIPTAALPTLAPEVQRDPATALDGGPAGDELIRLLITEARPHFTPGGQLALEIGHDQSATLAELLARENYQDIRVLADYQDRPRFLFARYG